MASPSVLDFDPLLAPISDDAPAGTDIRTDTSPGSIYYQIKDARTAARAAERQAATGDAEARADWKPVLKHGEIALAQKTKDLEVAAYMIEALVRVHGFAGLRDGLQLARGLVENFWDGLYPLPDEDGLETRLAPIASLSGDEAEGVLIQPIAMVPLTDGSGDGPYALFHYQQAVAIDQMTDEEARARRMEQAGVSRSKIQQAASETSTEYFVDLVDDLKKCSEEFESLCSAFAERCDGRSPPASNLRDSLNACLDAVRDIGRGKLPLEGGDTASPDSAPAESGGPASSGVPGTIRTRDDALQTLLRVSDYFRRSEPHNPISYALEQAVRWSRMPLPDLMMELIPDESARSALFRHIGIRPPDAT